MGWIGHLDLHYRRAAASREGGTPRTIAHDRHEGPLRVLQSLYPEGDAICHQVLVHPPGGIVGGDRLFIDARLDAGTHALITTPGATRYYKSGGAWAEQTARLQVGEGARLEWLPLETIAYDGCRAHNRVQVDLAPGAQMLGWDLLVLGLPASGQTWSDGHYRQHLEVGDLWIDRAAISAADPTLLRHALAWGGYAVSASCWFATAEALPAGLGERLVEAARSCLAGRQSHRQPHPEPNPQPNRQPNVQPEGIEAGVSQLGHRLVLVRALAAQAEPVHLAFRAIRQAWRQLAWDLQGEPPRIWAT
jgi:urease accessory protein